MGKTLKRNIQRFGNMMSAMVMPNIGAFIAWGILAALFIPAGYFPNERLNELIAPTLNYLLPLLIGYTAGNNIYGRRGGVAGAIATIGVIVGSDVTMLVGGMIMGPLGAITIKTFDKFIEGKVKSGLEMMVDNFSMGILGAILMVFGYFVVGPIYQVISSLLMAAVSWAQVHNVLQLSPIAVVPGQLLFLNNAINHGIFTPLGIEQAAEMGKSIIFLIESNGGPWTALALAFAFYGRGIAKKSAPGATLIQFIGGIGECVFPYALTKPITILGPMIGQIVSLYWFTIFGGGTVAAVSPGSFPALVMMSSKSALFANVSGYFVGGIVSFLIVRFFLKRDLKINGPDTEETISIDSTESSQIAPTENTSVDYGKRKVEKVYFCCDAGMGSSVMASSILATQLNKVGMSVKVEHSAITEVPSDADVVVVNSVLYDRAISIVPEGTPIFKIDNLMAKEEHAEVAKAIAEIAE